MWDLKYTDAYSNVSVNALAAASIFCCSIVMVLLLAASNVQNISMQEWYFISC